MGSRFLTCVVIEYFNDCLLFPMETIMICIIGVDGYQFGI